MTFEQIWGDVPKSGNQEVDDWHYNIYARIWNAAINQARQHVGNHTYRSAAITDIMLNLETELVQLKEDIFDV